MIYCFNSHSSVSFLEQSSARDYVDFYLVFFFPAVGL